MVALEQIHKIAVTHLKSGTPKIMAKESTQNRLIFGVATLASLWGATAGCSSDSRTGPKRVTPEDTATRRPDIQDTAIRDVSDRDASEPPRDSGVPDVLAPSDSTHQDTSDTESRMPDTDSGQTNQDPSQCKKIVEPPSNAQFVETSPGTWRRRLPAASDSSGCGVYRATLEFDLTASAPDDWDFHVDYSLCNQCTQEKKPLLWKVTVTGGFRSNLELRETNYEPAIVLADTSKVRYPVACHSGSSFGGGQPHRISMRAFNAGEIQSHRRRLPAVSYWWDRRNKYDQASGPAHPYYRSPVDYSDLEKLTIWWPPFSSEWPSDCSVQSCGAHRFPACEAHGIDVEGYGESRSALDARMIPQDIETFALPKKLREHLVGLQRAN